MPGEGFDTPILNFVVRPLTSALLLNGIVSVPVHYCRYALFKTVEGSWGVLYTYLTFGQGLLFLLCAGVVVMYWPGSLDIALVVLESGVLTLLIQRLLISLGGVLRQDLTNWRTGTEEGVTFVRDRFACWIQLMNIPDATVKIDAGESGNYTLVVHLLDQAWIGHIQPSIEGVPIVIELYGRTVLRTETGFTSIRNGRQPNVIVRQSD